MLSSVDSTFHWTCRKVFEAKTLTEYKNTYATNAYHCNDTISSLKVSRERPGGRLLPTREFIHLAMQRTSKYKTRIK